MILLPGGGDVALEGDLAGGEALGRFYAGAVALRDAVATEALDAPALRGRILGLAAMATEAAQAAAPALGAIDPSLTQEAIRTAFDRDFPGHDDATMLGNALIYDRYFEVERAPQLSRAAFAAYALAAWADVLADLPETLLGRDEIAAFLAGICATCAWLGFEAPA